MTFHKRFPSFAILILFCALTAQAQHTRTAPDQDRPDVWSTFIGSQLAQSLDSPVAQIRNKALEQVIMLARSYGKELDLSAAVPGLLEIYTENPDEQFRLAEITGLHAIGDEGGLQQMRLGLTRQPSKLVQHVAISALLDHYGPGTFEGAEDISAIAKEVLAYYEANKRGPPLFIAVEN